MTTWSKDTIRRIAVRSGLSDDTVRQVFEQLSELIVEQAEILESVIIPGLGKIKPRRQKQERTKFVVDFVVSAEIREAAGRAFVQE